LQQFSLIGTKKCGQLVSVKWSIRQAPLTVIMDKRNFLYTHDEYVNPVEWIKKKNVTILFVDNEHLAFCVTPESKYCIVINSDKLPFQLGVMKYLTPRNTLFCLHPCWR